MEKIAIIVAATASYNYALHSLLQGIFSQHDLDKYEVNILWAGCDNEEHQRTVAQLIHTYAPSGVHYRYIDNGPAPEVHKKKGYTREMNLYLARMHGSAFAAARQIGADYAWSVEADVIPPPNALRCMVDMLRFDEGYYDVAMCTYPAQGGGAFMGGRGSHEQWIMPDVYDDERAAGDLREKLSELSKNLDPKSKKAAEKILQEIKKSPAKGNVFELNARQWRRRGWLDNAYPGIGKGAVLPTDWTGLGCVLLSRRALTETNYTGYTGDGTGDLFLNHVKWGPAGIRRCVIPHVVCSHVCRVRNKNQEQDFDDLKIALAYHEQSGECQGHLRQKLLPFSRELPMVNKNEPDPNN